MHDDLRTRLQYSVFTIYYVTPEFVPSSAPCTYIHILWIDHLFTLVPICFDRAGYPLLESSAELAIRTAPKWRRSTAINCNFYGPQSRLVEMSGKILQYRDGKEPSSVVRALSHRGRRNSWAYPPDHREMLQPYCREKGEGIRAYVNARSQLRLTEDRSSEGEEVSTYHNGRPLRYSCQLFWVCKNCTKTISVELAQHIVIIA